MIFAYIWAVLLAATVKVYAGFDSSMMFCLPCVGLFFGFHFGKTG